MINKVTIIVPVYNVEKYLKKCINSLINQTMKEIKIIAINDGSTDNSKKILDEFKEKYIDKIEIINKENGGQATARNLGIDMLDTEYVLFVDSDDYIDLGMVENMYKKAINENADIVVCNYYEGNDDKGYNKVNVKKTNYNNDIIDYIFSSAGPCNKLIKSKILLENNIRFLEKHIYEDLATIPLIGMYAKKIIFLDEPYYYYFIRSGSTMRQQKYNSKVEDIFIALEHLKNELIKRNLLNNYNNELEYLYIEHLLYAGCGRFLKYKEGKSSFNKAIDLIKQYYPNWEKNKYYLDKSKIFKITCKLFYSKNYLLISIYNLLRKIIKRKEI